MTEDTRLPEYGTPAVISLTKMRQGEGQGTDCQPGSSARPNCITGVAASPNCPQGTRPVPLTCTAGTGGTALPGT
jgi:hypothetical protein